MNLFLTCLMISLYTISASASKTTDEVEKELQNSIRYSGKRKSERGDRAKLGAELRGLRNGSDSLARSRMEDGGYGRVSRSPDPQSVEYLSQSWEPEIRRRYNAQSGGSAFGPVDWDLLKKIESEHAAQFIASLKGTEIEDPGGGVRNHFIEELSLRYSIHKSYTPFLDHWLETTVLKPIISSSNRVYYYKMLKFILTGSEIKIPDSSKINEEHISKLAHSFDQLVAKILLSYDYVGNNDRLKKYTITNEDNPDQVNKKLFGALGTATSSKSPDAHGLKVIQRIMAWRAASLYFAGLYGRKPVDISLARQNFESQTFTIVEGSERKWGKAFGEPPSNFLGQEVLESAADILNNWNDYQKSGSKYFEAMKVVKWEMSGSASLISYAYKEKLFAPNFNGTKNMCRSLFLRY